MTHRKSHQSSTQSIQPYTPPTATLVEVTVERGFASLCRMTLSILGKIAHTSTNTMKKRPFISDKNKHGGLSKNKTTKQCPYFLVANFNAILATLRYFIISLP